ncbi:hypothetical protein LIER_25754 [Lithospermum erythrorhizon]|uniref:Uncharacterized protein n=1 Tax=Lithospermum erythrorhizon TaxID=34254 RepID=A0AAV3R5X7_LITER
MLKVTKGYSWDTPGTTAHCVYSRKATKLKKKVEESSADACRVVEQQVVEKKAQNVKGRKKSKGGKAKGRRLLLRRRRKWVKKPSLIELPSGVCHHVALHKRWHHNNQLSICLGLIIPMFEILSPIDKFSLRGDDVGETIAPIVEGRVCDFSHAEDFDTVDLLEQTDALSDADSMGKTTEPSNVSNHVENVGVAVDNPKKGDVNMSSVGVEKRSSRKGSMRVEVVEELVSVDVRPTSRRKGKGKLKINENKNRVGINRIPKNVVHVPTENVALHLEEEEAEWKFVASRRIAAERMLSEVTKKNVDIMGILKDVGVMPTVETIGPYYPKLVREFYWI